MCLYIVFGYDFKVMLFMVKLSLRWEKGEELMAELIWGCIEIF